LCAALVAGGCATLPPEGPTSGPARSAKLDPAIEERLLALDPQHLSDADVRQVLAKFPAPHVMNLHGGVYPVYLLMENFSRFLVGMGYPDAAIRDAGDGSLSQSPYGDSARQAGELAWYYERDGERPMLIGHSQGGIQAIKILHELAGNFVPTLRVYNPVRGEFEARTTIVDPLTGMERPVVGVSMSYVAVVGTGGVSLALPNHWVVVSRIRDIPDTVDEFTGFRIGVDLFAWDAPGLEGMKSFHSDGKAHVRNVTLPAEYSHVIVPMTSQLTKSPAVRDWINAFQPDVQNRPPLPEGDTLNIMWAADVWYSVKKHWCIEAQNLVRARRARADAAPATSDAPRLVK
jgi:hypothetical protein